jgi:predicted acyl esterase
MHRRSAFSLVFLLLASTLCSDAQKSAVSAPTYELKIDFNQRVTMRDGVQLDADVYRPDATGKFPVIIARTPYNKSTETGNHLAMGRYFAARGYVYVAQDVRGRGDSDGVFIPYRNDGPDGYDSIEWCAWERSANRIWVMISGSLPCNSRRIWRP